MKCLAIFILIFSWEFANSQSAELDAKIINGDTLNEKIKVWVNMFNHDLIRENSFYRKLSVVDGEKINKIKTKEISQLTFTDINGKERKFISDFLIYIE